MNLLPFVKLSLTYAHLRKDPSAVVLSFPYPYFTAILRLSFHICNIFPVTVCDWSHLIVNLLLDFPESANITTSTFRVKFILWTHTSLPEHRRRRIRRGRGRRKVVNKGWEGDGGRGQKQGGGGNEAQKLETLINWNTALSTAQVKNMKFHENQFGGSHSVPCGQADTRRLILILAFHIYCVDAPRNAYLVMCTSQSGQSLGLVRVSVQQESTVAAIVKSARNVFTQELKIYCSWKQSMCGYIKWLKIM